MGELGRCFGVAADNAEARTLKNHFRDSVVVAARLAVAHRMMLQNN
jgi:hypothetical protein